MELFADGFPFAELGAAGGLIGIVGIIFRVANWAVETTKNQSDMVSESDKEWISRLEGRIESLEKEIHSMNHERDKLVRNFETERDMLIRRVLNANRAEENTRRQFYRLLEHLQTLKVPIPAELFEENMPGDMGT